MRRGEERGETEVLRGGQVGEGMGMRARLVG